MKPKAFTEENFRKFLEQESTIAEEAFESDMDKTEGVLERFNKWRHGESALNYPLSVKGKAVYDAKNQRVAIATSRTMALAMLQELNKNAPNTSRPSTLNSHDDEDEDEE